MTTTGIPPQHLSDADLLRELASLHRTRNDALRHASPHALAEHSARIGLLEGEYLRRWPTRELDPARTRQGHLQTA